MLDKTNWMKVDVPDLTKPSLKGLVYLLRHPELWPDGFSYRWGSCKTCAMGLAKTYWKLPMAGFIHMSRAFDIGYVKSFGYFMVPHGDNWPEDNFNPNRVADYIEQDLK